MYKIYEKANYVHVYLNNQYNIMDIKILLKDEWWERAWTLQEYLANENIHFYDINNNIICSKYEICDYYNDNYMCLFSNNVIEIPKYLKYKNINEISDLTIRTVLNLMYKRKSTREEDKIYSLMGILNTYITPLYGEGLRNATERLIREYLLKYDDGSIFDIFPNLNIFDLSISNNKYYSYKNYFNSDDYICKKILKKYIQTMII